MARIPFVDTHFHLHDMRHPELRYAWLEPPAVHPRLGDISAIKSQAYRIDDFIAEIRFANVPKAVHVQAALGTEDPVEETRWLQSFADRTGYPQAIVAECHLDRPGAHEVLERHGQYRNLRGIRDFGPPDYLRNSAWLEGWRLLSRYNLVSCLDVRHTAFAEVVAMASTSPDTLICVDHCGIPESRTAEYFASWCAAMRHLATAHNVYMKISGLGMCDNRWTIDSLRPWIEACIEAFGTDRIVFGTNWPVDRMYSSYPDVINAYATIIASYTESEQQAMFSGNAERLFKI
jgi:predicted TIM-barrel fold metal-dependent hydrolase